MWRPKLGFWTPILLVYKIYLPTLLKHYPSALLKPYRQNKSILCFEFVRAFVQLILSIQWQLPSSLYH